VQALRWAGSTLTDPGGLAALAAVGAIHVDDVALLTDANETLLDVRVALHRVTGGRSDVLALQDQDAVAAELGHRDADDLIRSLARAARRVAWVADDAWSRLRDGGPRRPARDAPLAPGLVVHDGRLVLDGEAPVSADGTMVLRLAATSVDTGVPIDRSALAALRDGAPVSWSPDARADFLHVLASGRRLIDLGEALDHENLLRLPPLHGGPAPARDCGRGR
jgi:[protein-PII] uridylyltransferase